jgi:hypothetical protein
MGNNFATELATGALGPISIEDQIAMHLNGNHYPPVPLTMVKPCIEAIDAYWEDDLDAKIELPEGVLWRGETTAPAWSIIEGHHLSAWCTEDDYSEEEGE